MDKNFLLLFQGLLSHNHEHIHYCYISFVDFLHQSIKNKVKYKIQIMINCISYFNYFEQYFRFIKAGNVSSYKYLKTQQTKFQTTSWKRMTKFFEILIWVTFTLNRDSEIWIENFQIIIQNTTTRKIGNKRISKRWRSTNGILEDCDNHFCTATTKNEFSCRRTIAIEY